MRARVVEAVEQVLLREGYDGLSVEAVAIAADVHRTTIYRRWRDIGGLLADTLQFAQDDGWRPPDTGELATDLIEVNRAVLAALVDEPSVSSALVAASFRSSQAANALRDFWEDRYRRCEPLVSRACARGEVPEGTDPDQVLVAATGPLYHELILLRRPVGVDHADHWARAAARAASSGTYRRTTPLAAGTTSERTVPRD